jgi:hypothetical protein
MRRRDNRVSAPAIPAGRSFTSLSEVSGDSLSEVSGDADCDRPSYLMQR